MKLNENQKKYLHDYGLPSRNPSYVRDKFSSMFKTNVPDAISGFVLDPDSKETLKRVWPEGEPVAQDMVQRFLHTEARASQIGSVDPLSSGAKHSDKQSRISKYHEQRDVMAKDTTSRIR